MEALVKGDVVVLPYPYSDFTETANRPAVVCATLQGDDVILCQISGQERMDKYAIRVSDNDFNGGHLKKESVIRPNKILTTNKDITSYKIGTLQKEKMDEIEEKIIGIFKNT